MPAQQRAAILYGSLPLIAASLLLAWVWSPRLAEDAYIALRYSVHLASGLGLVYNPGEPPVEGATSFLNTVLVAGAIRLGIPPERAAQAVAAAAWLGACVLLLRLLPTLGVHPWAALAAALALALSPLAALVAFGFDTALGVCFSTLVAVLLHRILLDRPGEEEQAARTRRDQIGLPAACLLLCLARPEGAFLAVPALLLACAALPRRHAFICRSLLGFALPGLLFFVWRWRYFGYPLPNTFYVKHEGSLFHPGTLLIGLRSILAFSLPALLLIAAWWRQERQSRWLCARLCAPWLVFLAAFLLINNEQNALGRFQLPALPWILTTAAVAWTAPYSRRTKAGAGRETALLGAKTRNGGGAALRAWLCLLSLYPLLAQPLAERHRYRSVASSTYAAGRALEAFHDRAYAGRTYGLMVSEAGVLPFYSRWRTLDAHGLNDPEIAHHGLTWDRIDRFRPDVVEFHVA
ncbi:MAG TPA: hypothetical protein VFB21_09775, partial [Chthonomonadaceae bacterium]|nr:hypothetical protein [Chthonomonadaceae bacterium]